MASNEHPDMSGNPCDEPFLCDKCGTLFDPWTCFGCETDEDKIFCSQECADSYDLEGPKSDAST